jgi:histidine decarboxylase
VVTPLTAPRNAGPPLAYDSLGRDVETLTRRVIGPFDHYCAGCPLHPEAAYVVAPILATAAVPRQSSRSLLLDQIIAFDKAEAAEANLTQTNLIQVSSFCGPQGLLLGYDLFPQPLVVHPGIPPDAFPFVVYDVSPLLTASKTLLGTVEEPHFPIRPGQHVLCAYKVGYAEELCTQYAALAIALPENRNTQADLIMEDHGVLLTVGENAADVWQRNIMTGLLQSIDHIGANLHVRYVRVFVGLRGHCLKSGEVGCALTAASYLHLATEALC